VVLALAGSSLSCRAAVQWKVGHLARDNPQVLYRVETQAKAVALTIDDGPDAATTPEILRVLERNGAHATFFIITSRVPGNEDLLRRMVAEGHELGNHLLRDEPSLKLPPEEFERQLVKSDEMLSEFATRRWFRPGAGWYDARMLAPFVDEPARVTPAQMDRWCRDFDNWGICDTACFVLFDRTPHAWGKVSKWAGRREEFVKRSAFALLASLAVHDKQSGDAPFLEALPLIEAAASDARNFVMKGVSWALRVTGRRSQALNKATIAVSRRLAESTDASERWIGKGALRELTGPVVARALARKVRR